MQYTLNSKFPMETNDIVLVKYNGKLAMIQTVSTFESHASWPQSASIRYLEILESNDMGITAWLDYTEIEFITRQELVAK